ncbi:hypothetical protein V8C26DRAFT_292600 [Trichoderma gracile]
MRHGETQRDRERGGKLGHQAAEQEGTARDGLTQMPVRERTAAPATPPDPATQAWTGQEQAGWNGMGWGWAGTRPDDEGWPEGGPLDKITGNGRTRGLSSSSSSNPVTNFPGPVSLYVTPTLPTKAGREGWKERAAGPLRLTDHIGSRVTRSAEVQLGQEAGSSGQRQIPAGRQKAAQSSIACIGCYLEPGTSGGTALSSEMDSTLYHRRSGDRGPRRCESNSIVTT